jgi:membrane dipeptidase
MDARLLLQRHLVWDNHACMPLRPGDDSFLPQIERAQRIGVDVISINIGFGPQTLDEHVRNLAAFRAWFGNQPERYVLAGTVEDIESARAAGKLAILFDIEGLAPFDEGDHGLLAMFAGLGVRWALIAYNRNNAAGGGCMDEDGGLTPHGRALLREMARVGIVPCCSHTGHRTARDVLDAADGPVIFSHSNALALHEHARNIPDDLVRACAETGGVVGINGIGPFLGKDRPLFELIADHVDHMVQLVGPEHVAISLDYVYDQQELIDYLTKMRETFPNESAFSADPQLAPPEDLERVVDRLVDRGYGEDALSAILGGNWMRVARKAWR